jgi:hypothetical protein
MFDFFTIDFWKSLWDDFIEWMLDFPIWLLSVVLDAIATVIEAINPPSFMSGGGLSGALGPTAQYIGSFLAQSGFAEAFGILGIGLAFRLTRKLVTLGQW